MARKSKEQSAKSKAAEAANEAVTKAKDLHGKAANPANLKAYKDAKDKADAANKELARERFETIGVGRVETALTALGSLAKCANKRSYEFTEADIAKIKTALVAKVETTMTAFETALKGGSPASKETFSL